jgi:arylsulfatase
MADSVPSVRREPRPKPGAPNVVIVVLDDLGFAQLGCYGSDIATPHIDRLAREGLRYNNFHVTAMCSPTRACLLTGRNHHAVGMGYLTDFPMGFPGYTARLPRSAGTLPRLLRDQGYNTFAVGKWHLGPSHEHTSAGPFDQWPLGVGFERFYGFLGGLTNQWTPDLVRDNGFVGQPCSPDEGYHLTEDLATQAIRYVQEQQQAAPGKPFFLYLATGAVHSPFHVPGEWVDRYRHCFDGGWQAWRDRTFARQRDLGVVPPGTVLTERPAWVPAWEDLSPDERRHFALQMETFAGFLSHTDAQIGRVMDYLRRTGVLDNTVVLLLSDNGAAGDGGPRGSWPEGDGRFQTRRLYAWSWAWAGNTPLRLWKRYTWLGGVRTPLVVRWPARIPQEDNGLVRAQFVHAIDLMPAVLEATGVEAPDVLDGVTQQPFDGSSILATLDDGTSPPPRRTQYFELMGSRAIYHDGWKATTDHVADYGIEPRLLQGSRNFDSDRWSLFHLDNDFSEAHDVAAQNPDRVRQLISLWWHEAGRGNVLPLMDDWVDRTAAAESAAYAVANRYVWSGDDASDSVVRLPASFPAGFQVSADIEVPHNPAPSCMICTFTADMGGWACYVLDSRLVLTVFVDDSPDRLVASEPIRPGRHELRIICARAPEGRATMAVTLDGEQVCRFSEISIPTKPGPRRAGKLTVGRAHGLPLCDDCRPPFPFTGTIYGLVFQFGTSTAVADPRQELAAAVLGE